MHGAVLVSSQYMPDALIRDPQQSCEVKPAASPAVLHPGPAHIPQPTGQHTTPLPSIPSVPSLQVLWAVRPSMRKERKEAENGLVTPLKTYCVVCDGQSRVTEFRCMPMYSGVSHGRKRLHVPHVSLVHDRPWTMTDRSSHSKPKGRESITPEY